MITACELCTKINMENIIREESIRIKKKEVAEKFAEEIISPILIELKEIPEHLFIGYRYGGGNTYGLYKSISDWHYGLTNRGNSKKTRQLINSVGVGYSELDYEVLNQYLIKFGFQISVEKKWVTFTKYSTSTPDTGLPIDYIYLSMICPIE